MGALPAFLLRHTVTIEPYQGAGANGPIYGAPVVVPCFIDDTRRMVRGPSGTEVVSEAAVYCALSTVAPAESRVTANGRVATVIIAKRRDGGGLPTPDHLEVMLT